MPFAERVSEIAGEAKVDAVEVWAMVRTRGVMHDSSGSFARRVLDASRRRRVMAVAEAVYVALGEGGTLPDAVEALESLLGEVRGGEGPAAACCDDVSHKFKPVSA